MRRPHPCHSERSRPISSAIREANVGLRSRGISLRFRGLGLTSVGLAAGRLRRPVKPAFPLVLL